MDFIWGGNKIINFFHREKKESTIAESWEISDRDDAMSIVLNGYLRGKTLRQLVEEMKQRLYGEDHFFHRFPILLKIIDANQNLSVQVHPDNENAQILGAEPKTECWYILDAEKDAKVYIGFNEAMNPQKFEKALKEKRVIGVLREVFVKKGDVLFIPGGRVHAIAKGCLILEAQQNSNTTYRVYDWNRVGKDGKSRDLHLNEAFQVINWGDCGNPRVESQLLDRERNYEIWSLIDTPYFQIEKLLLRKEIEWISNHTTFEILFTISGKGSLEVNNNKEFLFPGKTYLVPAAASRIRVTTQQKEIEILRISLPPATIQEKIEVEKLL